MKSISKAFALLKLQPLGCLFALLLASVMLAFAIGGMIFTFYAISSVSMVKDAISSTTGFHPIASNIYVNVYTGNCRIDDLILENPSVYDYSADQSKTRKFIEAEKVFITLSPTDLLKGKFTISSLKIVINRINCTRLNNSTYNLPEFLTKMSEITLADSSFGNEGLDNLEIEIKGVAYSDSTIASDTLNWTRDVKFSFKRTDIKDVRAALRELAEELSKADLAFVAEGLTQCLDKK